jgi:hypothetical protein
VTWVDLVAFEVGDEEPDALLDVARVAAPLVEPSSDSASEDCSSLVVDDETDDVFDLVGVVDRVASTACVEDPLLAPSATRPASTAVNAAAPAAIARVSRLTRRRPASRASIACHFRLIGSRVGRMIR